MKCVEYEERFGEIHFPDGFAEELRGKSIEEQMGCYAVSSSLRNEMSYHMMCDEKIGKPAAEMGFDAAIVKDGLVVGFMRGDKAYLPYRLVTSSYDSDNNGAGYKERTTRYYLGCVAGTPREVCDLPPFGAPEHVLQVSVTEWDGELDLPQRFLDQIKGKSIVEQLDYFVVGDASRWFHKVCYTDPSFIYYRFDWCSDKRVPLRYDHKMTEIFVKDGVIAAVKYRYCLPEYNFDQSYMIKFGEITEIRKDFGQDEDGVYIGLYQSLTLQPVIYGKE